MFSFKYWPCTRRRRENDDSFLLPLSVFLVLCLIWMRTFFFSDPCTYSNSSRSSSPPLSLFPLLCFSPCSVSWSSRPVSQAKTWVSCVVVFVPVPLLLLPSQILTPNVVSALPSLLHLNPLDSWVHTCLSALVAPLSWVNGFRKRKPWCVVGHTAGSPRAEASIYEENHLPQCWMFGINTPSFRDYC